MPSVSCWEWPSTSATDTSHGTNETSFSQNIDRGHCNEFSGDTATLSNRIDVILKPIDYIGLYIIVTVASGITVNWLFRIYFP